MKQTFTNYLIINIRFLLLQRRILPPHLNRTHTHTHTHTERHSLSVTHSARFDCISWDKSILSLLDCICLSPSRRLCLTVTHTHTHSLTLSFTHSHIICLLQSACFLLPVTLSLSLCSSSSHNTQTHKHKHAVLRSTEFTVLIVYFDSHRPKHRAVAWGPG